MQNSTSSGAGAEQQRTHIHKPKTRRSWMRICGKWCTPRWAPRSLTTPWPVPAAASASWYGAGPNPNSNPNRMACPTHTHTQTYTYTNLPTIPLPHTPTSPSQISFPILDMISIVFVAVSAFRVYMLWCRLSVSDSLGIAKRYKHTHQEPLRILTPTPPPSRHKPPLTLTRKRECKPKEPVTLPHFGNRVMRSSPVPLTRPTLATPSTVSRRD